MNNEIYGRLQIIIENDRGRKKSAGWKQTIRRVFWEAKFSLVRLNEPLDRVSLGLSMRGVEIVHVVDSYESFQLFKFKLCTMH